ncbi:MAG: DUF1801 domain-containing protein [Cyclobacteriaceae bacterium]
MAKCDRSDLQSSIQAPLSPIENYILGLEGQQRAIVQFLHLRISEHHGLVSKLSYKIPMYYRRTWVCYLNPLKNGGIELAFAKGHRLSNEQGILSMKKRKYVAGVELSDISKIPESEIDEIIQEALILDDLFTKQG